MIILEQRDGIDQDLGQLLKSNAMAQERNSWMLHKLRLSQPVGKVWRQRATSFTSTGLLVNQRGMDGTAFDGRSGILSCILHGNDAMGNHENRRQHNRLPQLKVTRYGLKGT